MLQACLAAPGETSVFQPPGEKIQDRAMKLADLLWIFAKCFLGVDKSEGLHTLTLVACKSML